MTRYASIILAALLVPAAAFAEGSGHGHATEEGVSEDEHVTELDHVRLVHAWSRATDGDETLVFMEIENGGDAAVVLTGGETAVAAAVEVVGYQLQGGTGTHVVLGDVPIAAGARMTLAPDGVALRLTGLSEPLHEGESFALKVLLGDRAADVTVAVEAATALQHSHAGHDH